MENQTASMRWWLWWAAFPYGLASRLRTGLYRRGWLTTRRLPCRVVSVGNLTVGGTGKTPVVICLAEWLLSQGKRVGVLSRGYRRQSRAPRLLVSDGRRLLAGPSEAGDEPYLIAKRCPRAVVAVGADRYELGRWVLERFPIDCFLLDDGFQHVALHRDVNLLLIDATDRTGLKAMFPVGRLREPLSAAARATAVLLTRAESQEVRHRTMALLKSSGSTCEEPIFVTLKPEAFIRVQTGERAPLQQLAGISVLVFSGIANPASFRQGVEDLAVKVVEEIRFRDHYHYRPEDMTRLREAARRAGATALVTTEKDAVKVAPLLDQHDVCWAVRLGTALSVGDQGLEGLLLSRSASRGQVICAS